MRKYYVGDGYRINWAVKVISDNHLEYKQIHKNDKFTTYVGKLHQFKWYAHIWIPRTEILDIIWGVKW